MVRAYVLIQTSVGLASEVAQKLSAMPRLDSAVHVTGPYDVVASVSAEDLDDLGRLVAFGIGHVPGVTRTVTCTVMRLST